MLTKIPHQVRGTVEAAMDTVTCLETPHIVPFKRDSSQKNSFVKSRGFQWRRESKPLVAPSVQTPGNKILDQILSV